MFSPVKSFKSTRDRTRAYLRADIEEVTRRNLAVLRMTSVIIFLLLVVLLGLALVFIRGWSPTVYHYAFLPVSLVFCLIVQFLPSSASPRTVTTLCVLLEIMLYAFVILIDTLGDPAAPSSFTQLVCIALPAIFILRPKLTYGLLLCAEAAFAMLVVLFKDPFIGQYDLFQMAAAIIFSVVVTQLVMGYRMDAFETNQLFESLSKRDTLSSLYNKRAFFEKVADFLAFRNPHTSCSLAIIDLDEFKMINDRHGHDVGDEVLMHMGELLLDLFRPSDLIARFGGDEYLVLADNMVDEDLIRKRWEEMSWRFAEIGTRKIGMATTCSVGVIYAVDAEVDFTEMFRQADKALYHAKSNGKNQCEIRPYRPAPIQEPSSSETPEGPHE